MRYRLETKTLAGYLYFEYDKNGILTLFKNHSSLEPYQVNVLIGRFPMTEEMLRAFTKASKSKLILVPEDLTFERFWSLFAYKVGKIPRCRKLWSALEDADKAAVLESIPQYKRWISRRSVEHIYPETYLAQERWKNEFIG